MADDSTAVEERLKGYIEKITDRKLEMELSELADKHFVDDLGMDSVDMMELLLEIEEQENVKITDADLERFRLYRFGKLTEHVRQQQGD